MHLGPAPFPEGVRRGRQGSQRGLFECLKARTATAVDLLERPRVQILEQLGDRGVELAEREERPVAESRQDPALDDLYAGLDLGFVAWLSRARRQDRQTIVLGKVLIARVEFGLVAQRPANGALEIIRVLWPTSLCG
jgi:hypothetical protein